MSLVIFYTIQSCQWSYLHLLPLFMFSQTTKDFREYVLYCFIKQSHAETKPQNLSKTTCLTQQSSDAVI